MCALSLLPASDPSGGAGDDDEDPFARDPERHPALLVHTERPYNGEPPAELLATEMTTPNELFYVRNHLPVPHVDLADYALKIVAGGPDKATRPQSYTLQALQAAFKPVGPRGGRGGGWRGAALAVQRRRVDVKTHAPGLAFPARNRR